MAFAVVAMLGLPGAGATAADWPMVAFDASGNHAQPDAGDLTPASAARLAPRWTFTTKGSVNLTPAIVDGAAYLPDAGGMLWKLDVKTGQPIWSVSVAELTGIDKSFSRTSPAYSDGMIFIAINRGANVVAVDAATGRKLWMTQIDAHPSALLTSSPVVAGNLLLMPVSSSEQSQLDADPNYPCCTFRGSLVALDKTSGQIVWKTYTMPDNGGKPGGYSGGAALAIPAVDEQHGLVFFSTDHQYTQPASVEACLQASRIDADASCFDKAARFNSVIAVDIKTGAVKWSFFGAGTDVYETACIPVPMASNALGRNYNGDKPGRACPAPGDFLDWSFATGSPQLFTARIDGADRELVGIGEKSGIYWAFDRTTGAVVWHTLLGPFSEPGGITWGGAYDGKRLYATVANIDRIPYRLASGAIAEGGIWTALDPSTGTVLWQAAAPDGAVAYSAPAIAGGVLFVATLAGAGNQMLALDAATGKSLWSFASGGSVGAHPAVVDGVVYWGSGFSLVKGSVKNDKVYAFSVDGK